MVVCELDNCGILAIGRCGTCKRPYCGSHVAYNSYGPIVNFCVDCQQAQQQNYEQTQQDKRDGIRLIRQRIEVMIRMLGQAGVPTERYLKATRWKSSLLFGERQVRNPAGDQFGWKVGVYPWMVWGSDLEAVNLETYVTEDGEIAAEGGHTIDHNKHYGPTEAIVQAYDMDVLRKMTGFWTSVADALERLLKQHGVDTSNI